MADQTVTLSDVLMPVLSDPQFWGDIFLLPFLFILSYLSYKYRETIIKIACVTWRQSLLAFCDTVAISFLLLFMLWLFGLIPAVTTLLAIPMGMFAAAATARRMCLAATESVQT